MGAEAGIAAAGRSARPAGETGDVDVSFVIVNWNTRDLLLRCLASVYRTVGPLSHELWLVDNASADGSVEAALERFPDLLVIRNPRNLGFAAANNRALRRMRGRYAVLLNTDAQLTEGAVRGLFAYMEANPQSAMACGQLLNPDGTRQNSVANFPSLLGLVANETLLRLLWPRRFPSRHRRYDRPLPVDSCIGACLMVRKRAMDRVGLLDERYFFFFEETDWARQMHAAGYRVCFVPDADVYHAQGQSAGSGIEARILYYRSRYQYLRKWHPRTWRAMSAVVVARLAVNTLLTALGIVVTLGLAPDMRTRFGRYLQLLLWHFRGCPGQRLPEDRHAG